MVIFKAKFEKIWKHFGIIKNRSENFALIYNRESFGKQGKYRTIKVEF